MSKYDKFWRANELAGDLVATIANEKAGSYTFSRYGAFTIETADICVLVSQLENSPPELGSFTWMHETTFRNYSESNPNTKRNPSDDFDLYDVGPRQVNVGLLKANILNKYISIKGLDLAAIIGTKAPIFNGDPIQNARCADRILLRQGQSAIVGSKDGKQFTMFPSVTSQTWATMPYEQKSERRVVAYTGPEARPYRLESWRKFGPLFKKFFEEYQK